MNDTSIENNGEVMDYYGDQNIEVFGAREHNLKNIDLTLPRNKLIVLTGISGSGKSSLAFDTIYAEGQRRYMETFSAYARSVIGGLERPDVDKVNGLSPVISIEQKTTSKNPRSTVGTTTEIYDFFRLLFARAGEAYSYETGEKMVRQSEDQIIDHLMKHFDGAKLTLLAPLIRGRKGHYRELFQRVRKLGFNKVRVDGEIRELEPKMQVDRYKIHDIEIVVDRVKVKQEDRYRISQSVNLTLKQGKGTMIALDEEGNTYFFSKFLTCPTTGISYDEPAPHLFSFNSPYGACPTCGGLGYTKEITADSIIPDPKLTIAMGGIGPLGDYKDTWIFKKLNKILKPYGLDISTPLKDFPEDVLNMVLYGPGEKNTNEEEKGFEGIIPILKNYRSFGSDKLKQWVEKYTESHTCADCGGARLKREARHFKIDDKNISELAQMNISRLSEWLTGLEGRLSEKQNVIAREVLKEIRKRIGFLQNIGLDYLALDRPLKTLSGGEAQRIRLATQIGTQLVSVLYILDEPSIGLHQRDNHRLIQALQQLRDQANTVIVVEHDRDMMLHSDHILDIGPGAGRHGGKVVAQGSPEEVKQQQGLTAEYLRGEKEIPVPLERRAGNGKWLKLEGATGHNLKDITFEVPLGKMLCLTGVSGSGKSSLIHETLYPILSKHFFRSKKDTLPYRNLEGLEHLDKVIEIDQTPIGRTPRSNPATYTGVFSDIRQLFAQLPEAKIRGYKPGRFSFNVKGGRCETCQGAGMKLIEMDFLPDVHVPCETCRGKRYNRETLEVRFKGKSISDVLEMTVEQATEFFSNQPRIYYKLKTLYDVGLEYVKLGQHATTLSGGEAQRVKLATELSKKDTGKTFYILDEPTTGLHFEDIRHLLNVLGKLVDKGNTVLVIEHNMDIIKTADHVTDLGPEGGDEGGYLLASGTPEEVAEVENSYTGQYLKEELATKKVGER